MTLNPMLTGALPDKKPEGVVAEEGEADQCLKRGFQTKEVVHSPSPLRLPRRERTRWSYQHLQQCLSFDLRQLQGLFEGRCFASVLPAGSSIQTDLRRVSRHTPVCATSP